MIHIGMGCKKRLAFREREIQIANQVDDLIDVLFVTDIDQQPFVSVENQVQVATDQVAGLNIQLDNIRENRFSRDHKEFNEG